MDSLIGADLWQLTANGVVRGAFYAALGAGLALVLGVTARFHFAYALTYVAAPYAAFWSLDSLGLSFWPAALVGLAVAVLLSVLIELLVYEPVSRRAGDRAMLAVLVTSIGLSTAGAAVLQLVFGTGSVPFYGPAIAISDYGPVRASNFELFMLLTCVGLVVALAAFLAFTPLGRSVKAVRSNPPLAAALGIGLRRVNLVCFAIAGLVSGAAALWSGLLYSVDPGMGDSMVMYAFVVAFLAGTRTSPLRALAVGVGVGLLEQWSSIWLSVQWSQTAVFTVLVAYLVVLSARGRWRRLLPARRTASVPALGKAA